MLQVYDRNNQVYLYVKGRCIRRCTQGIPKKKIASNTAVDPIFFGLNPVIILRMV